MTDDVEYLHESTTQDIPADRILDNAPRNMQEAILVGWNEHGVFYFASSTGDPKEALWLLELAKQRLLEMELE